MLLTNQIGILLGTVDPFRRWPSGYFDLDAMRGATQRIFRTHPPDQRAQIRGDLRPASKRGGFPAPVPTEAGPMPTDKGLRSDDRDGPQDRWEPPVQLDQEQAIPVPRASYFTLPPLISNTRRIWPSAVT